MLEKLTELLDRFAGMGVPSYDCSVWHHGREIYRRMYGYSDYEKTRPIDGSERYNIYSCSKPITVTAALTLYEKGLFGLDDKLSDYMPEFAEMTVRDGDTVRPAKTAITIRQLFTMTAGFSYNLSSPGLREAREATGGVCPTRETMRYLAKDPLLFDPGTRYEYSLCHDVLAALVEVLTGMTFGQYVKQTIFDPLCMKDTTFLIPDEQIDTLAAQYRYDAATKTYVNCGRRIGYKLGSAYESGGAGCISTVNDYIKFLEAHREGRLLKEETMREMTTNQLTPEQGFGEVLTSYGYGYGLGVRCPRDADSPAVDFGWGGAAAAYLVCDRVNDCTLYYAQHVLGSPNQNMRNEMPGILREALHA
ncbi:MAG: beta-lactamase family protein [Clostridia bacterium]|nr:beta-lactamase family protein [Clostridia bacterium]